MNNDIFEKLKAIAVNDIGIDADKVKPESDIIKELGLDSLDIVDMLMKVEETFGVTIDDILVHDAHCQDDTLQLKLAMMDGEHGFPVALGVIRDVEAPTYDEAVWAQIEEVSAKKKYHNFSELLETNDIWEVK